MTTETEPTKPTRVRSANLAAYPSLEGRSIFDGAPKLQSTERCSLCGCICGLPICRFCAKEREEMEAKAATAEPAAPSTVVPAKRKAKR